MIPQSAIRIELLPWKDKTPVFAPEEGSDDGEDQGSKDETGK